MKSGEVTVDDSCEVCSYPLISVQFRNLVSLVQSLFFCKLDIGVLQIPSQCIVFILSYIKMALTQVLMF